MKPMEGMQMRKRPLGFTYDHEISGIRGIKHPSSERFVTGHLVHSTRHGEKVHVTPRASGRRSRPPISTSYSCLLIPMCVAAWWIWTKRKARRLVRRLMHSQPSEDGVEEPYFPTNNDDFSTWCVSRSVSPVAAVSC